MWSLLKFFIFLAMIAVLVWFGSTVKMGKYTLFGHVSRIWHTEEAQDLVKGARETAGPAVKKVKRGVQAGLDEASRTEDAADAGPGHAGSHKKHVATGP
jgi:hypothetical protein